MTQCMNITCWELLTDRPLEAILERLSLWHNAVTSARASHPGCGSQHLTFLLGMISIFGGSLRLRSLWCKGARSKLRAASITRCLTAYHGWALSRNGQANMEQSEALIHYLTMQTTSMFSGDAQSTTLYISCVELDIYSGRTACKHGSFPYGGIILRSDQHQRELQQHIS